LLKEKHYVNESGYERIFWNVIIISFLPAYFNICLHMETSVKQHVCQINYQNILRKRDSMSQCEQEKRRKLMRIVMGNENNDLTHIKLYFHFTLLLMKKT